MDDAEIKALMREKGACGEVFVDERGVKVTCLLTPEQHHAEVARLRKALQAIIDQTAGENRMRFVAQGPRAAIALVNIAREALK